MALEQYADRPPPYTQERKALSLTSTTAGTAVPQDLKMPPTPPLEPIPASQHSGLQAGGPALTGNGLLSPSKGQSLIKPTDLPAVPKQEPGRRTSPADTASVKSSDEARSTSMDNPDDRMAAEALCGLGKVESARSTTSVMSQSAGYETPLKYYPIEIEHTRSAAPNGDSEPLLSLLTSSHPWLGGTINGSLSAYSSTKSYSPRFIRAGADFVERNIGSHVANTVGTVGRKTGVEGSLRRYLNNAQRPSETEQATRTAGEREESTKRRRISSEMSEDSDVGYSSQNTLTGHGPNEPLPLYDGLRSPAYEDVGASPTQVRRQTMTRSWSTQLMISTSGLGAALNDASLRSLKFVLDVLRKANSHVANLMEALKDLLRDYDSGSIRLEEGRMPSEKGDAMQVDSQNSSGVRGGMSRRIKQLNAEIWNTLKSVVTAVSRYTGDALPENASVIVRWQLMSVPRRWQRAVSSRPSTGVNDGGEKEAVTSAHQMLAFAVEGIDMMEQVGGVIESTLASAERWLESMGRKSKGAESPSMAARPHTGSQPQTVSQTSGNGGLAAAGSPELPNAASQDVMME